MLQTKKKRILKKLLKTKFYKVAPFIAYAQQTWNIYDAS